MNSNNQRYIVISRDITVREYDIRTPKGNKARKPRVLKEGKKLLCIDAFLSTTPFRHGMYCKLLDEMDGYMYIVYTKDVKPVTRLTYIKEWYIEKFPTDDLGYQIKENITFKDAFANLGRTKDFYTFLGVGDSIVRERVFEQLSKIYGVSYAYIYNKWMS